MAALMWMMQTKDIPAGQRKRSGCVESQIYEGTASLRLSTTNPVSSRKPDTWSLHQKPAAG